MLSLKCSNRRCAYNHRENKITAKNIMYEIERRLNDQDFCSRLFQDFLDSERFFWRFKRFFWGFIREKFARFPPFHGREHRASKIFLLEIL